jgi:hypothetical protein
MCWLFQLKLDAARLESQAAQAAAEEAAKEAERRKQQATEHAWKAAEKSAALMLCPQHMAGTLHLTVNGAKGWGKLKGKPMDPKYFKVMVRGEASDSDPEHAAALAAAEQRSGDGKVRGGRAEWAAAQGTVAVPVTPELLGFAAHAVTPRMEGGKMKVRQQQ